MDVCFYERSRDQFLHVSGRMLSLGVIAAAAGFSGTAVAFLEGSGIEMTLNTSIFMRVALGMKEAEHSFVHRRRTISVHDVCMKHTPLIQLSLLHLSIISSISPKAA